jgi:hypothetical protein
MAKYRVTILLLAGLAFACNKKTNLESTNSVLTLQTIVNGTVTPNASAPADNYTYLEIRAVVDSSVVDTTTTISFATDNGTFSTGGNSYTSKIDVHGYAYAYLKSKYPIPTHVQGTAGSNYTQNLTIQFTTSYPDSIFINLPDSLSHDLANRLNFTATLYKLYGVVTPGLTLTFSADTNGKSIGSFTHNVPSDSTGTVNAQFWLNDTTYTGFLYMKAAMPGGSGQTITGTNMMVVTK